MYNQHETPCSPRRWNVPHSRSRIQNVDWIAPTSLARDRVQDRGRTQQVSLDDEQVETHCFSQEAHYRQEGEASREGGVFCRERQVWLRQQEPQGGIHP